MPLYEYQCLDCGEGDRRLAGVDDHTALCVRGGGLMLRRDEDLFTPYFAVPIASVREQDNGAEKSGV